MREGVDLEISSPPQDGQLAHLTSTSTQPPAEKGEGGARLRSCQPDGNVMHGICWELRYEGGTAMAPAWGGCRCHAERAL